LTKPQTNPRIKSFKYKIKQTFRSAKVTVYGNAIEEVVADYIRLRVKLESEGFKVASEE
jgi:hypothetical protein